MLNVKTYLRKRITRTWCSVWLNAGTARSTGHEPNLIQNELGTHFRSIADGDDEDRMDIQNFSAGTIPIFSKSRQSFSSNGTGRSGSDSPSSPEALCIWRKTTSTTKTSPQYPTAGPSESAGKLSGQALLGGVSRISHGHSGEHETRFDVTQGKRFQKLFDDIFHHVHSAREFPVCPKG